MCQKWANFFKNLWVSFVHFLSISSIFLVNFLSTSCPFLVNFMSFSYLFHANFLSFSCILLVYFLYISCQFHVNFLSISCPFLPLLVYCLSIYCLFLVYLLLIHVNFMSISMSCLFIVNFSFWQLTSDPRTSDITGNTLKQHECLEQNNNDRIRLLEAECVELNDINQLLRAESLTNNRIIAENQSING